MPACDKIVVVTKKTALDELVERFNTRDQARFYIEHMGGSFDSYQAAHNAYALAAGALRASLPKGMRTQWIDRSFLPNFTFGERDLVVTLGPDGLVVNTAKYLDGQPVLAVNPDPSRIDGVLLPFGVNDITVLPSGSLERAVDDALPSRSVTMAMAALNDGQVIHALNDLFIGQKTHVSARYLLRQGKREESQSSSGIIVSTGAGSTGWRRSVLAGAVGVVAAETGQSAALSKARESYRFEWEARRLVFSVREPFVSKTSSAGLIAGVITDDRPLEITSLMPQNGVIFSDGVEEDHLDFNSGSVATVGLSTKSLRLLVPHPDFGRVDASGTEPTNAKPRRVRTAHRPPGPS